MKQLPFIVFCLLSTSLTAQQRFLPEKTKLPDGTFFSTWENDFSFSKTYHVNQKATNASDTNSGTEARPFKTINRAAQVVKPGEQVLVHAGHYREQVVPALGGTDADHLISYEAAPGEEVIISGSEPFKGNWQPSKVRRIKLDTDPPVWQTFLPREWFVGYNPFASNNRLNVTESILAHAIKNGFLNQILLKRGLIFQDGKRLKQVLLIKDLINEEGSYWVNDDGLEVRIRPFRDINPNEASFEMTVREQVFAPKNFELGFIRVKEFTIEHGADGWPWSQKAALSSNVGHHWIIEKNTVRQTNAVGIDVGNQSPEFREWYYKVGGHIVRQNEVYECGIAGIMAMGGPVDMLCEDNYVHHCCWQEAEDHFENAGIKIHHGRSGLFRRNRVEYIKEGSGIWLDYDNRNCRVTGNLVQNIKSKFGGIFMEASMLPVHNLIDNNIILHVEGAGIYAHDCDYLKIYYNMTAHCSKGIYLKVNPNRIIRPLDLPLQESQIYSFRGSTCRKNDIQANLFINNRIDISIHNPDNFSDKNVFVNPSDEGHLQLQQPEEKLEIRSWQAFHGLDKESVRSKGTFAVNGTSLQFSLVTPTKEFSILSSVDEDFFGKIKASKRRVGPFAGVTEKALSIDPRLKTN